MLHHKPTLFLCLVGLFDAAIPSVAQSEFALADDPTNHPVHDEKPTLEWLKFEDYLMVQRYKQKNDPHYGLQQLKDSRKDGTYWRASKAAWLDDGKASIRDIFQFNDEGASCGLAFYYDDIKGRMSQYKKEKAEQNGNLNYLRPVAIAPVCDEEKIGPQYTELNCTNIQSIFYYNMQSNTYEDAYLLLSNMKNNTEKDYVTTESFAMKSVKTYGDAEYSDERLKRWYGDDYKDDVLVDWANAYAKSIEGDWSGRFPNPYKFAFGDRVWSDWNSAGDFWGWEGDKDVRTWKVLTDEKAKLKRSRVTGALGA